MAEPIAPKKIVPKREDKNTSGGTTTQSSDN